MLPTPWTGLETRDDFGLPFSNTKYSATLAVATDTLLTVPGSAPRFKAIIKAETDAVVYLALNEVAQVPAGAAFAATGSEMLEVNGITCREVKAADVMHFISAGADIDVSVTFYAIR